MTNLRWETLDAAWQAAFTAAWEAYRNDTNPIGAAISDSAGHIVAVGRNRVYDRWPTSPPQIGDHRLAHAELNAMLNINTRLHMHTNTYTITTTMEPCAMCLGAIAMNKFKKLRYASRDRHAGAIGSGTMDAFLKQSGLQIAGPLPMLESVQIALLTYKRLSMNLRHDVIDKWAIDCPEGVERGRLLWKFKVLEEAGNLELAAREVFELILS